MEALAQELRQVVADAEPALRRLSPAAAAQRPAPGKWSPKEILGHLIDSASNNHQRFVRAQFTEALVFPGYDQAAWVQAQRYQQADWEELLTCWAAFNRRLAHVIAAVPAEVAARPRQQHNLHQIAWQTVPEATPATLAYFMQDYVGHLRHHLRQIPQTD